MTIKLNTRDKTTLYKTRVILQSIASVSNDDRNEAMRTIALLADTLERNLTVLERMIDELNTDHDIPF